MSLTIVSRGGVVVAYLVLCSGTCAFFHFKRGPDEHRWSQVRSLPMVLILLFVLSCGIDVHSESKDFGIEDHEYMILFCMML